MPPLADALLPLLASGALKGAVLLLAAAGVARMLRGQAAAVRHAVWTMALAGVLLVPLLALAPGLPAVRAPVAGLAAFDAGRPLPFRAPWERDAPPRRAAASVEAAVPSPGAVRLADVLVALWLLGAALALAREAVGQGRASRLASRAAAGDSHSIRDAMHDAAREIGGGRRVPVRLSGEVGGPVTLGVLRPMILLPPAAAEWPAERLRAALLHELAHVARRDCATDLVARLACALWWFDPLVWMALRRTRAERERACDDRVLAARVQPVGYAALLVDVARVARGRPLPAAAHALPMARRMSELEARLRAILDPTLPRARPSRAAWCALSAGSLLAVAACASVRLEGAPALPPAVLAPAAGQTVATAPEPDRAGDSVSHPASERIPGHAERMADAIAALRPALRGPDSAWAGRLRAALADEPEGAADLVRERAAWALTRAESGRLMEPMLRALADPDWRVRSYAAWALAQAPDARAVRPLLPLLRDRVWRVRAMAAFALAQTGDPAAEPAMRAALHDPAWQVRTSAVEYVGTLRHPGHLPLLRARLADRHPVVRGAAQAALARIPS